MNNTELTTSTNAFSQLADFNLDETMTEELDGLSLAFDRIRIPSGGSTVFELPGEDAGEPETIKEFTGVILYHHPVFAYYKEKYTGGNTPPDCGSFDGVTGEGDPGGLCAKCRLNQFGTGENGSKACQNRRRLYILREGEVFPLVLSLPTGSLKEFTRYIQRLLSKGQRSAGVVTKFSLKKAVNAGGLAYSQAQFSLARKLTAEELPIVAGMAEQIKAYDKKLGFIADQDGFVDIPAEIDPDTGEIIDPMQ